MDVNKDAIDAINSGNERFQKKKRQEQLSMIPSEYVQDFGAALDYEDEGNFYGAKQKCREILAQNDTLEPVKIMLARVYPKLLEQDIYDNNMRYSGDAEEYFDFLDSVAMNDDVRAYIVEIVARMCEIMGEEGYRPIFSEFLRRIEEKNYLAGEEYGELVESANASIESGMYFSDTKISIIMKNVLKSGYERKYVYNNIEVQEQKIKMEIDIYTNMYYFSCYYAGHEEEVSYIKDTYPYSYANIIQDVEKLQKDEKEYRSDILNKLLLYVSKDMDTDRLTAAMDKAYEYMLNAHPQAVKIHSGRTTYRRNNGKIGRNDPCPCGSGKKYKQCCGR